MGQPFYFNRTSLSYSSVPRGILSLYYVNNIAPNGAVSTVQQDSAPKILGGHGDGAHPFPFRTGKLSPSAPMVLPLGGRVGRRLL